MNKKIRIIIIGIVTIFVMTCFTGCTQESNSLDVEKNKFVGTWKINELNSENVTNFTMWYIFSSDGNFSIIHEMNLTAQKGTWDVKNGKLVLTLPLPGLIRLYEYPYSYHFSNNDKNLTLTPNFQGTSFKLTKQ